MASFPNLQFNFLNGEKEGQDLIGLARLSPYIFVGGNHPEYMTVDGYNRTPTLKHFRVNVSELGKKGSTGSKSILDLDTRNLYFGHNTKTFSESKIVIGQKGRMAEGFTVKGLPVRLQQVHFRAARPNDISNEYSAYFLVSDPVGGNYAASPYDDMGSRKRHVLANSDYIANSFGRTYEFKSMDWASGEDIGSRYDQSIVDFSSRMIVGDQFTIGRQNLWDEGQGFIRAPFNDGNRGNKHNMANIAFDETSFYLTQNGKNDYEDGNGYVLPLNINVAATVVANTGYFTYDLGCRQYQEWNINQKADRYAEKFDSVVLDFMPKYRLDDPSIDGKVVEDVPIMVRKPPPGRNSVILSKNGKGWSTGACPTDFSFRCILLNEEAVLPPLNENLSAYVRVRGGLVHLGSFARENEDQVLVVESQNKLIKGNEGYIWLKLHRYKHTQSYQDDFYGEWVYYILRSDANDEYKNNSDTEIWILLAEVTNIGEDARGECMGIIHHQCGDIRLEEGVGGEADGVGRETAFPAKITVSQYKWYFEEVYTSENATGFTQYVDGEGREGYLLEVNNFPAPESSEGPTQFYAHVVEDESPLGKLSYSFEYPFDNIFLAEIKGAGDKWTFNEAIPEEDDPDVIVGFYTRSGDAIEINGILPHQDNTDNRTGNEKFYAYVIQYETDPKTYYFSYPLQKGEYSGQVLTWGGSSPRWKNPRVFPATISVSGDQFSFLEIHTGTESGDALRKGFCYEANSIKCKPGTPDFETLVWEDVETWNPSPDNSEEYITATYYFNLPVLKNIGGESPSPYDVLRINEGGKYWEWGCVQVGTPESSGTDESSGS